MLDEEKQAMEYLKRHIIPCYGKKGRIEFMLNDTLLNLIEKQSKEIEELKEKNKELNKYIEDRAKIGKNIQTFINKDYVEQEYISKDKIKSKIEEVKDGTFDAKIVLQSLLEKE